MDSKKKRKIQKRNEKGNKPKFEEEHPKERNGMKRKRIYSL